MGVTNGIGGKLWLSFGSCDAGTSWFVSVLSSLTESLSLEHLAFTVWKTSLRLLRRRTSGRAVATTQFSDGLGILQSRGRKLTRTARAEGCATRRRGSGNFILVQMVFIVSASACVLVLARTESLEPLATGCLFGGAVTARSTLTTGARFPQLLASGARVLSLGPESVGPVLFFGEEIHG